MKARNAKLIPHVRSRAVRSCATLGLLGAALLPAAPAHAQPAAAPVPPFHDPAGGHPGPQRPLLSVEKRVPADAGLPDPVPVGTEVPYEYEVTNGGDSAIRELLVIDDVAEGVSCPRGRLWPGESMTCHGSYVVTEEDVARGSVTNTAVASGTIGETVVTSPPDRVTVDLGSVVGLALTKSVEDPGPYEFGERARYTYTVRNLTDQPADGVAVVDDLVPDVVCATEELAPAGEPGDTTRCAGRYEVSRKRGDCGEITNTAAALTRDGRLRSEPDSATISVVRPCGHHHH
ncbi:hypothetical protein FH609_011205 [Streptomyces sp. 3MP-14]|uniref:DUF7507 domain-containing protein n=1 Tax=Streptomyces mimosae TaxID=2586635 RepID=A0A5N6AE87_9ACTN|nr:MULTISPECIES: hypothetical protein [Streptomyces]KAB8166971.1 hypothetical protein FH607_008655 [Streptomyces mimosae]KAB8176912.1 hypothetical protein FH609_011205 [Streptomyces sp. 3MP-14]